MELSVLNIGLAMAAGVIVAGYVAFILIPAWRCYGRVWERIAASLLSLYILLALIGVGLTIGFSVFWFYDRYA